AVGERLGLRPFELASDGGSARTRLSSGRAQAHDHGARGGLGLKALCLALVVCFAAACGPNGAAASKIWVEPTTGMAFVSIPAGSFTMGSPPGEAGRELGEVQHVVTMPRSFWMGKFEVTQT